MHVAPCLPSVPTPHTHHAGRHVELHEHVGGHIAGVFLLLGTLTTTAALGQVHLSVAPAAAASLLRVERARGQGGRCQAEGEWWLTARPLCVAAAAWGPRHASEVIVG